MNVHFSPHPLSSNPMNCPRKGSESGHGPKDQRELLTRDRSQGVRGSVFFLRLEAAQKAEAQRTSFQFHHRCLPLRLDTVGAVVPLPPFPVASRRASQVRAGPVTYLPKGHSSAPHLGLHLWSLEEASRGWAEGL